MTLYAMNCLHPIQPYIDPRHPLTRNGRIRLHFSPSAGYKADFQIPCGKCVLCRESRYKEWVRRLQLESFDNPSSFLTLTYDDDHLEDCNKHVIQKFLKKFRQLVRKGLDLSSFKYFFVSEYGKKSNRPHYHALFFGVDLLRNPFFQTYTATYKHDSHGNVFPVYSSSVIASLWDKGFISVDRCTDKSIKYVAKYILKQNPTKDTFRLFSRRLGTNLFLTFDKSPLLLPFGKQTFSSGKYLLERDSFPVRSPRFLDYYTRQICEPLYDAVKESRKAYAANRKENEEVIRGRASLILSNIQTAQRNEIL